MRGVKTFICTVITGLTLLYALPSALCAAGKDSGIHIQPETVKISSFFSGAQMHIACDLPPDREAVLCIKGKRIEEELMRKSHQWELWMNRGEVDIDNAPILYIALSSDPYLISRGTGEFPWGYDALEAEASFSGSLNQSEDSTVFNEFLALKERDNLYQLYPGKLKINRLNPDRWEAVADFKLPSRVKPGTYHVTLWIIRNGLIVDRCDSSFEVLRQGLPEALNSLAMKHGLIYGFMAVVIAMIVGLLTGLAFHHNGNGH